MKDKKGGLSSTLGEALVILAGEVIVSLITALVFLLIGQFDYTVVTGAALGSFVTVLNYLILAVTVKRAIDKYMELRGDGEMTEEEAEEFARANAARVQLAASGTYVLRTLLMLGTLVGAFLLGNYFNVFATVVPLLAYRPIIHLSEAVKSALGRRKKEVE